MWLVWRCSPIFLMPIPPRSTLTSDLHSSQPFLKLPWFNMLGLSLLLSLLCASSSFASGAESLTRSNKDNTRIQFSVACRDCFKLLPDGNLKDGFVNFEVTLSRRWGLDGDNSIVVNGRLDEEHEDAYSLTNSWRYVMHYPLFNSEDDYEVEESKGYSDHHYANITYTTLVSNWTHEIRGISYEISSWDISRNYHLPERPLRFMLTYMRRPRPQIIRVECPTSLSHFPLAEDTISSIELEQWTNPSPSTYWPLLKHGPILTDEEVAAEIDTYWVECKTLPCHINKLLFRIRKSYTECVELQNDPELASELEESGLPLHCHVYLMSDHWLGQAILTTLSLILCRKMLSILLHSSILAWKAKQLQKEHQHYDEYNKKVDGTSTDGMAHGLGFWACVRELDRLHPKGRRRLHPCPCDACYPKFYNADGTPVPSARLKRFVAFVAVPFFIAIVVFWAFNPSHRS